MFFMIVNKQILMRKFNLKYFSETTLACASNYLLQLTLDVGIFKQIYKIFCLKQFLYFFFMRVFNIPLPLLFTAKEMIIKVKYLKLQSVTSRFELDER